MDSDRIKSITGEYMKKLLLINPVGRKSGYMLSRLSTFSPLNLAYVAAVTPDGWTVEIADENFDVCEFEEADLVGITAFSSNINRAYEIAERYRQRNIKVILGGIHGSMMVDEALQYVDTVVIGEAEGIWEQVIRDFEKNRLLPVYNGPVVDLSRFDILPRRDLLHPDYLWHSVQTSRGCPFNCSFCSVTRHLGSRYRQRHAEDVLEELKGIKSRFIAFVDDNLIGYSPENRQRAAELFRGMAALEVKKKWWMQTSMNVAKDEEIVRLAAEAGCMFVFIGFETFDQATLKNMRKGANLAIGVENYKRVSDLFHKYGIGVLGAFIIGNDFESRQYYTEMADLLIRSGIDIFQISILTPLPGTTLMERFQEENRLLYENFPEDWDKFRFSYMVYQPEGLSADIVYTGDNYIKNKLYSFPNYYFRMIKSLISIGNMENFYVSYKLNKALKTSWKNSHYCEKYPKRFKGVS